MRQIFITVLFFCCIQVLAAQGTHTYDLLPSGGAAGSLNLIGPDSTPTATRQYLFQAPAVMPAAGDTPLVLFDSLPGTGERRCVALEEVSGVMQFRIATGDCGTGGGGGDVFTNVSNTFTATPQSIDVSGATARWNLTSEWDIANANAAVWLTVYSGNSAPLGGLIVGKSIRGTKASPAVTQSGDNLLQIAGGGWATFDVTSAARIDLKAGSTWSATNFESYITMSTVANSSTVPIARWFFGLDSPGGLTMLNNEDIWFRDAGGTPQQILGLSNSNIVTISTTAMNGIRLQDDVAVAAGSDMSVEAGTFFVAGNQPASPTAWFRATAAQSTYTLRVESSGGALRMGVRGDGMSLSGAMDARDIIPLASRTYDLGSVTLLWDDLFAETVQLGLFGQATGVLTLDNASVAGTATIRGGSASGGIGIEITTGVYPSSGGIHFGLNTRRWGDGHFDRIVAAGQNGITQSCASTATIQFIGGIATGC